MNPEYRLEPCENGFLVIDPWGEHVETFPTEAAARQAIESCKKDDAMWETARLLVEAALQAHMEMHGVDRETAHRWLKDAAEVAH
jgi:hypothetical protein